MEIRARRVSVNLKYTIAIAILSTVTVQSIGGQARVEVVVVSAEDAGQPHQALSDDW